MNVEDEITSQRKIFKETPSGKYQNYNGVAWYQRRHSYVTEKEMI